MSFITDKQTLEDLNLLSKYKTSSVYSIFNIVRTRGGKKMLDEMFSAPMQEPEAINSRSNLFAYFGTLEHKYAIDSAKFELMDDYLSSAAGRERLDLIKLRVLAMVGLDKEYQLIRAGFEAAVELLREFHEFINLLEQERLPAVFEQQRQTVLTIFRDKRLAWLTAPASTEPLSLSQLIRYDNLLRFTFREDIKVISGLIYLSDLCIAVSTAAKTKGFCYALAKPADANVLTINGLRHPEINHAVGNSILLDSTSNVLFLTGANMAGKSTLMKAFGIAVYLAHMGFPVPAASMVFSVRDGIYTSINVPDNLNLGYSHFYAEVLRVKMVAEAVSLSKRMVIIFDELFKGTNVKDAYDATLAVTKAFAGHRDSAFIISTHIIEVGVTLAEQCDNIQFVYLPTIMDRLKPTYTYQLKQGITSDRHGMMIINNEKILEIIRA